MYHDIAGRIARHEEEIRRLKLRAAGEGTARFSVEHTFIVGGEWNSGTIIPPMVAAVGPNGIVESKAIVEQYSFTHSGFLDLVLWKTWHAGEDEPAGTTGIMPFPHVLADGDRIMPIPQGSGSDLTIMIAIEVQAGNATWDYSL